MHISVAARRVARRAARRCAVLPAVLALAACAAPPPLAIPQNDPHEAQNREMHALNKALDRGLIRPAAMVFGEGAPGPIPAAIQNASRNLRAPRNVVNMVLQGRLPDAVHETTRFAVNSTIGLGGVLDPATAMGLDRRTADFGQTLHVWGLAEGDYLELPLEAASTERDTLGIAVDFVIDPVGWVLPDPLTWAGRGVNLLSRLSDRARHSRTIDSILYQSADSYAQLRLVYLENRRFELGQGPAEDEFIDPYAE